MDTKLPAHTDILIVGGGPAGLATAVTLLSSGCKSLVILDTLEQGQNISRAVVIHAQTMEAVQELSTVGCSTPILERGIKAQSLTVRTPQRPLLKMNFSLLKNKTHFPHATLISQTDTESILEARLIALGGTLVRPVSVTALEPGPDGITATLADGRTISATYVVGADGARSFVRAAANIPFRDPKTSTDPYSAAAEADTTTGLPLIIADVLLSPSIAAHLSERDLSTLLAPRGFLLLVPLPARPDDPTARLVWRMSCAPEPGAPGLLPPTQTYLQSVLDASLSARKRARDPVQIDEVLWSSRFRARSAVADRFAARMGGGTVVLVGDAAHVHSPAGGQGMNLGVRDAIALGRALAGILADGAAAASSASADGASTDVKPTSPKAAADADAVDGRLRAYSDERRAQALSVIKITKTMTWATGLSSAPAQTVRNAVGWVLGRPRKVEKRMAFRLSGLPKGAKVGAGGGVGEKGKEGEKVEAK
ncbi:hypothetical protein B0H11DRAFT_2017751 [Mycena galericulata]|nr:hypothetical protein B0H11DRAFT_2017751 [Mycena galericulata]